MRGNSCLSAIQWPNAQLPEELRLGLCIMRRDLSKTQGRGRIQEAGYKSIILLDS